MRATSGTQESLLPDVTGVRHAWRRAGEVVLHVAEAGDGPPLVLLHGWPQHWYEWRDLIEPLSREYRVICPDLRGCGWSEAPPRGYDRETMARDVLALLDGMGIRRFRLAGHDWGGWVGFVIAVLEPDRVERLLALNIAHPFLRLDLARLVSQWRLAYQLVLAAPGVGPWAVRRVARRRRGLVLRWAGAAPPAWDEQEAESFLSRLDEPDRVRASVLIYRDFQLIDLPRLLRGRYRRLGLRTPTLLLHGAGDHIVRPAHLTGYEPYAPNMRVELVEGVGHFIVDERPDLVLERARAFFA